MGWLGGVITRQGGLVGSSLARVRSGREMLCLITVCVQLEQDQSVRSVNLPLDSKRGGRCVGFARRVKRGEADGGYS